MQGTYGKPRERTGLHYYIDDDGIEGDYSTPMSVGAESTVNSVSASIDDAVGIDFQESTWDNADWVIDGTDDYDYSGVSLKTKEVGQLHFRKTRPRWK